MTVMKIQFHNKREYLYVKVNMWRKTLHHGGTMWETVLMHCFMNTVTKLCWWCSNCQMYTCHILQGPFVAAFASSNLGDVSPNVRGARCQFSGRPCDVHRSTCSGLKEMCVASGPGEDMFESTRIIAEKLFGKAWVSYCISAARKIKRVPPVFKLLISHTIYSPLTP
jgi:hypothetical protein